MADYYPYVNLFDCRIVEIIEAFRCNSPSKAFLVANQQIYHQTFDMAFEKRPEYELYVYMFCVNLF